MPFGGEDDGAGDQRQADRDHRRQPGHGGRAFGAADQLNAHRQASGSTMPIPVISRPIASRGRSLRGRAARDRRPWEITAMRSEISRISSRSWLITSTAEPRAGEVDQRLADGGGGAGIDAPGRLADDEDAGLAVDLAADDELLQVAAGERAGLGVGRALAHVEGLRHAGRDPRCRAAGR